MAIETKITSTFDFGQAVKEIRSALVAKGKAYLAKEQHNDMELIKIHVNRIMLIPQSDRIYGVFYSGHNHGPFHPIALELAAAALNVDGIDNDPIHATTGIWSVLFGPSLDDAIEKTSQRLKELKYAKSMSIRMSAGSKPTEM